MRKFEIFVRRVVEESLSFLSEKLHKKGCFF